MKPKKNTRMEELQLFSFINKIKRLIRRNSRFTKKFYYSVIVRTCFQKDNAVLAVGLTSIGSGIGQGTPLDIVGTIFLMGLIAVFCYYSYKCYTYKEKEKILAYDEDANPNSEKLINSTKDTQSQEPKSEFEEEESSEDSTDSEDDESFRENVSRYMDNAFRDLVFDRVLAHIVNQVDHLTFQARFSGAALTVTCYLRPELYSNLTRPLVGGLIRLEYNHVLRVFEIIELIFSNFKKKEGSPWVWNTVFAEIIGEYEEEGESIFYASLDSLDPRQVVPCKVRDYLRDAFIQEGDIVYLEVNETSRSYYYIVEIVDPCDS